MMVDVLAEPAQEKQAHSHSGTPQIPPGLFGYVENSNEENFVTGSSTHRLNHLRAGSQFPMREENKLIDFCAPTIEE